MSISRWPLLVLPLLLTLTLPSCRAGGGAAAAPCASASLRPSFVPAPSPQAPGQAFTRHGVFFRYPNGWRELRLAGTAASSGKLLWNETVGLGRDDLVTVAAYVIDTPVTAETIRRQRSMIAAEIGRVFAQASGRMETGPARDTVGGLPALEFTGTATSADGEVVESRIVLAFDCTIEYFVNCQHAPAATARIEAGCDQILVSFRLT